MDSSIPPGFAGGFAGGFAAAASTVKPLTNSTSTPKVQATTTSKPSTSTSTTKVGLFQISYFNTNSDVKAPLVNCDFSEVGIFFRNLISDNESFMFWYSFAEISTQNFNPLRRNHNLQKWPKYVNKLV